MTPGHLVSHPWLRSSLLNYLALSAPVCPSKLVELSRVSMGPQAAPCGAHLSCPYLGLTSSWSPVCYSRWKQYNTMEVWIDHIIDQYSVGKTKRLPLQANSPLVTTRLYALAVVS